MTLLQYYLFANLYILAFWIAYRICLRNIKLFKSVRIYLNSAIVLSFLLPLIQYVLTTLPGSVGMIGGGEVFPFAGIIYNYQIGEPLLFQNETSLSKSGILEILLMGGSIVTALIYMINHLKIKSIIKKSREDVLLEGGLKVSKSSEVSVPFIYRKSIVLPEGIISEELPMVLKHEALHYQYKHHLDNMLYSVLHIVFWINPFFLLLKKALKLNHEYQVDQQLLSSGMDQVSYKLSLVRYSVGWSKFSLANGLSNSNIKNRLLMINKKDFRIGKWRFFIMVPIIGSLFIFFCFACMQPEQQETLAPTILEESQSDTLHVDFIDLTIEDLSDVNKENFIAVLINRSSQLMIAGEKHPQNVEEKIINEYNRLIDEYNAAGSGDFQERMPPDFRIVVQKDLSTDLDDYQKLLDTISAALFKLREMHSLRLFGKNFDALSVSEKEAIELLVPLRIYGISPPKNMGPKS